MRQLWSTGWLHNRIRVVCASFLVKNLLLPWQWGLKHYWDALLDADLECAALGWQYCSGCLAGEMGQHGGAGVQVVKWQQCLGCPAGGGQLMGTAWSKGCAICPATTLVRSCWKQKQL